MAYQGYGLGLGRAPIEALYRDVVGDMKPDLTVILDIEPAQGLGRAATRGAASRYEKMDFSFHTKIREAFLDIAAREPDRCVVIPANRPIDDVETSILKVVHARLAP
jgi:dTMP kinase